MRHRFLVISLAVFIVSLWLGVSLQAQVELPTSTPASIQLASVTPIPENTQVDESVQSDDFAISGDTATPRGIVMLEPISEVNVRSSPEIAEDNQLGRIRAGERYMVVGRYFNWVQMQYDLAPDQRAWVYADLVQIIGNIESVPVIELNATPTVDPQIAGATQTQAAILAQPGGELTVTAQSRILQAPGAGQDGRGGAEVLNFGETPLPTFTYPPNVLVGVPTLEATREVQLSTGTTVSDDPQIAPIVPIFALGLFGVLGLLISVMRG